MAGKRSHVGPFADRVEAGRALADRLGPLREEDIIVVGLPRGGVPVAAEVAGALSAPLDIVVVRKIGAPRNPELALGAVGEDGIVVRNDGLIETLDIDEPTFVGLVARAQEEVAGRAAHLRGDRPRFDVGGRVAIVVDDGVATGATAEAAVQVLKAHGAAAVIFATPVATPEAVSRLMATADEVVVVDSPETLGAVGRWYRDFRQVSDDEVRALIGAGGLDVEARPAPGVPPAS